MLEAHIALRLAMKDTTLKIRILGREGNLSEDFESMLYTVLIIHDHIDKRFTY